MELLKQALLALHLIGFSLLLGGIFFALYEKRTNISLLTLSGARLQFISGIFLYGLGKDDFRLWAGSAKLLVALLIIGLLEAHRKKSVSKNFLWLIFGLIIVQLLVAVFALEVAK
jgi:hypothetical protein